MAVQLILLAGLLLLVALALPAGRGIPLGQRYRRLAGMTHRPTSRWRILALLPERWSVPDLVLMKLGCSLLFLLLTTILWWRSGMAFFAYTLPLQAVAGWALPDFRIRRRMAARRAAVTRELPQMMSGLAICLQTGLSLRYAVAHLSTVLEGSVLGEELRGAAVHLNLGATPQEALAIMTERCGHEELTRALSAVVQQVGKSPSAAGAAAAAESRMAWQRRRRRAEAVAQSASLKLFLPQLLLGLPALFLIILGPALLSFLETFRPFR